MRKIAMPLVFLAIACSLCAVAAAGQQSPIRGTTVKPDVIVWTPNENFFEFRLRVSGPTCGEVADRFFRKGETIFFKAAGLADGSYTYQLIGEPILDPAILEMIAEARKEGTSDQLFVDLCQAGEIACSPIQADGHFEVIKGRIVLPDLEEEGQSIAKSLSARNQTIAMSLCVGFDCPANPSYDDTTILLMENNTRIKFDDTSTISGFPNRDWSLVANSRSSGGANRFMIQDCGNSSQGGCSGNVVFAVEANAPSSALYVDDGGRIGIRTSTPSTEIHVIDGDTPTLRLAQSGSGGFAPQTWDVAGNETNFFVRDVTNGSTLPFRIRPGAPSSAIDIAADGDVGIGTASPGTLSDGSHASVHIRRTDGDASLFIEEASGTAAGRFLLEMANNGNVNWRMVDNNSGNFWTIRTATNATLFEILTGGAPVEFSLSSSGDLTLSGDIFTTNCPVGCGPDYVFEPDYELMPIKDLAEFVQREKHLPDVPSAEEMTADGINMTKLQLKLLEKIEELTLYTIDLEQRLAAVESAKQQ